MSQTQPLPEGDIQRWTAKRKAVVVLDLIKGKITAPDAARQHGLDVLTCLITRSALVRVLPGVALATRMGPVRGIGAHILGC